MTLNKDTQDKIIFIDRDGVINIRRTDYVKNLSEFILIDDVGKNLAKFTKKGFKIIVITNQSAVNRKLITEIELKKIHEFMIKELQKDGCVIDAVYYCPHTPNEMCECRKPKTMLFKKALNDFHIQNLKNSWMIGDSDSDINAAHAIGIKGIKINTDESIKLEVEKILL